MMRRVVVSEENNGVAREGMRVVCVVRGVSTTWVTRCGERLAWIGETNECAGSKLLMLAVLSRLVFSQ